MELAIEIENLCKTYPGRRVLKDISFKVKKGSVHGFLGPNGAGKSTTMKILSGLIPESSGRFVVNGRVGFLPEHPPLYPHMTVQDYLDFVFAIYSSSTSLRGDATKKIEEAIVKTGIQEVRKRLIGNLSKGYQQRVGIAQAIVHNPDIIILDEPTVGLDPAAIADIRLLIQQLKSEHTILFSSHQLHDVELLCSDITLINRGEIVVSGSMETILRGLKSNMVINARVENFNENQRIKMLESFSLNSVLMKDHTEDNQNILLNISTNGMTDQRAILTNYLADPAIGLLEFKVERGDLEELFKRIEQ